MEKHLLGEISPLIDDITGGDQFLHLRTGGYLWFSRKKYIKRKIRSSFISGFDHFTQVKKLNQLCTTKTKS